MIDLDRSRLDRVLPTTLGRADWDDVMTRVRVHQRRRRRRVVVLAAATLVAVVGTASAFGTVRDFFLDRGFIGLPPLGATPSAPEGGELELFYWVGDPKGNLGRSRAWVYGDGRLIWLRERADIPERANFLSTGFLEQRLTPEGVQLLRSEIASAGEFGDAVPPPPSLPPCPKGVSPAPDKCQSPTPPPAPNEPLAVPFFTTIHVRGLGRLVHVDRALDLERLEARLSDPESWLPADVWADRKIRAYVASKYAVCYGGWPPDEPMQQSQILESFPAKVADLLRKQDSRLRQGPLFGSPGDFRPSHEYCSDATTGEARALIGALENAGLERKDTVRLSYRVERKGSNREAAFVYFEPYLPHGETTCSACG